MTRVLGDFFEFLSAIPDESDEPVRPPGGTHPNGSHVDNEGDLALLRAACRIRTDDRPLTRRVLYH